MQQQGKRREKKKKETVGRSKEPDHQAWETNHELL